MNNTKTLTAIVAIFVAATLVVGTLAATTQSTYAYFPKKDDKGDKKDGGNNNGNTVTAQINKQKESQSGFDGTQEQEAENTICTHPASGASCVSEGAEVSPVSNQTGGGSNGNIVCPDGFVRAFLILHLVPERILDGQVCVSVGSITTPVPPGGCTGGLVAVTIASSDLNVCARVL